VLTIGHPDNSLTMPVPANAAKRKPNEELIDWRT